MTAPAEPPDWVVDVPSSKGVHGPLPKTNQWESLSQDQLRALRHNLVESIIQIIVQAVRGLFLPNHPDGATGQLKDWADQLLDLPGMLDRLRGYLRFGDKIPISHLDDFEPNMLVRNRFTTGDDIFPPLLWDDTVGHTSFLQPELGALKIVADGTLHTWESTETIQVTEGRALSLSGWVAASGLVSPGGNPIAMGVRKYLNGSAVGDDVVTTMVPTGTPYTTLPFTLPVTLSTIGSGVAGAALPVTLPVTLTTAAGPLNWTQMNGTYTVPAGVDSVTLLLSVTAYASTGTAWFDDLEMKRIGLIERLWVKGLPDLLQHLRGDGFFDGGKIFGNILTSVQEVRDTWDNFWGNVFDDDTAHDVGLQGFTNAVRSLWTSATNADLQSRTAIGMFNFGASQSIWGSANPTFETTIDISNLRKPAISGAFTVSTDNDPWSTSVTQASSAMGFVRHKQAQDKTVVQWLGKGRTNITGCKLHIYRMNVATGDLTWVQTETIVAAGLPNTTFDFVNVPLSTPVHVEQGDVLGLEVCIRGTGTHTMAGVDTPWLPDDFTARPKRKGAARNSGVEAAAPTVIADAAVGYNAEVPYIGAGVLMSELPTPKYVYTENFDGTPSQWTALAGGLLFKKGTFRTATSGANVALFGPVTYSDEYRIEFDFMAEWNILGGGFGNGDHIRLCGWANSALTQYVAVDIESNLSVLNPLANHTVRIVTGTSPTGATTIRATGLTIGENYSGRIGLEYDPQTNTYGVFLGSNATPSMTWTDTGNVILHGPGNRCNAIYANLTGNDQIVCDNFSLRDV